MDQKVTDRARLHCFKSTERCLKTDGHSSLNEQVLPSLPAMSQQSEQSQRREGAAEEEQIERMVQQIKDEAEERRKKEERLRQGADWYQVRNSRRCAYKEVGRG